jgi:hypothetical protein
MSNQPTKEFSNIAKPEVRALAQIADSAGLHIEVSDYGHSVAAKKQGGSAFYIARTFRPERDGSVGGYVITEETLRELMA